MNNVTISHRLQESRKNFISSWLASHLANSNQKSFVVGVSGGVDSALVSTLCVETQLPVHLVTLPIGGEPDPKALAHMEWLKQKAEMLKQDRKTKTADDDGPLIHLSANVTSHIYDLSNSFNAFRKDLDLIDEDSLSPTIHQHLVSTRSLVLANLQSRMRMSALYAVANAHRGLVVGTGNKIEDQGIGFFTKGGDGMVDLSPIGDMMKSEVMELARYMGVSYDIVDAAPTDGLWEDGRTDEDQIGATYDELEWAMKETYPESFEKTVVKTPSPARRDDIMALFTKRHHANRHKMEMPPVCWRVCLKE